MATTNVTTGYVDTMLDSANPTTNFGTGTNLDTYGAQNLTSILNFTLPSGSGTITQIKLFLYKTNRYNATAGYTHDVYQLLRNDWVETQATWNIFKTANNWTTAGALGVGTDYNSTLIDSVASNTPASAWDSWIITGTGGAGTPISFTWGDIVNIKMRGNTNSANINSRYASREHGTTSIRPYLEITYTPVGGTNSNFFAMMG